MIVKNVSFDNEARKQLMTGIEIGFKAIKSTLGPRGNTVLIEDENLVGGVRISKDGVTVANGINLEDSIQDLGFKLVREASRKSAAAGGDGSTTSFVLSYAILNELNKLFEANPYINKTELLREIQKLSEKIDVELVKRSKKVNGKTLKSVATISSNNNPKIGKLIADAYKNTDVVSLEHSKNNTTYLQKYDGLKLDRGFSSKFFVNNVKTNECVLNDCLVFITDIKIASIESIKNVLQMSIDNKKDGEVNKPLLIIGEIEPAVLATLNLNVVKGGFQVCNIIPPSFGLKKENLLSDLAVATGGIFYSQMVGDNFSNATLEGLGRASKVIVGQDKTIIIPEDKSSEKIKSHIKDLKESIKLAVSESEIKSINERIANISGSISTVFVGADTDIEAKELYDLVEDSILAVRSSREEGILPGGGVSLIKSVHSIDNTENGTIEQMAHSILKLAVEYPIECIVENAGKESIEIIDNILRNENFNYGYNAKTEEYGDMLEMGIIDPTKVVRNVLKNAVSVATTIASTDCIISNKRA